MQGSSDFHAEGLNSLRERGFIEWKSGGLIKKRGKYGQPLANDTCKTQEGNVLVAHMTANRGQRGRCPSRYGGKTPHDGFPSVTQVQQSSSCSPTAPNLRTTSPLGSESLMVSPQICTYLQKSICEDECGFVGTQRVLRGLFLRQ